MQAINRWRNWKPSTPITEKSSRSELTKLTESGFVSFVSSPSGLSPIIGSPGSMAVHDPQAWQTDFETWIASHCAFRDRCFGGIGGLYVRFCEWCPAPCCTRQTFEALLRAEGFETADGLVYGLLLKEDAEYAQQSTRDQKCRSPVEPC